MYNQSNNNNNSNVFNSNNNNTDNFYNAPNMENQLQESETLMVFLPNSWIVSRQKYLGCTYENALVFRESVPVLNFVSLVQWLHFTNVDWSRIKVKVQWLSG